MELSAVHAGLFAFVTYFHYQLTSFNDYCTNPDMIRDYVQGSLGNLPRIVLLVPTMYLLFNHENTCDRMSNILQFVIGCSLIVWAINIFKKCINPRSETNVHEYTLPIQIMTALCVCYYKIIHPRHHLSFALLVATVHAFFIYNDPRSIVTTSAIINDLILSTLVFMINRNLLLE